MGLIGEFSEGKIDDPSSLAASTPTLQLCKCSNPVFWEDKAGCVHCSTCDRPESLAFIVRVLTAAWPNGNPSIDTTQIVMPVWREIRRRELARRTKKAVAAQQSALS